MATSASARWCATATWRITTGSDRAIRCCREAILAGASPQLRNMATTGGNLLQRTRCYYFRDTSAAVQQAQAGHRLRGDRRLQPHSRRARHERALHRDAPFDMSVALAALDAVVRVHGAIWREDRFRFTDFHLTPGDHPERDTVLEPGELITAVDIPAAAVRDTFGTI